MKLDDFDENKFYKEKEGEKTLDTKAIKFYIIGKLREFGERLKNLTPGMGQHESEMLARELDKELKELQ